MQRLNNTKKLKSTSKSKSTIKSQRKISTSITKRPKITKSKLQSTSISNIQQHSSTFTQSKRSFLSTSSRSSSFSQSISPTTTSQSKLTNIYQPTQSIQSISKRTLFIQTHTTPNPRSLKFTPGKVVLGDREDGTPNTVYFDQNTRANARRQCELAYTILLLDGVLNVMLGSDFVTVTVIDDSQDWMLLKPMIFAAISDAYASTEPIMKQLDEIEPTRELPTLPGDEEAVSLIKEIIDLRIRPTVMDDGGDVEFIHFDKDRIVWLLMKGSCSGCPSSGATLKHGIQNMIMHYVPEVKSVDEWKDEADLVSDDVFQKLEAKLASKNNPITNDNGEKH